MVRTKYRYAVLKYHFEDAKKYEIAPLTFIDILKDLVHKNYGEVGLAKLGSILVVENSPSANLILFRAARCSFGNVKDSIERCHYLGSHLCKLDIVFVSGCVKNARKKMAECLKRMG
eukprot:jgi/Antlo1/1268/1795